MKEQRFKGKSISSGEWVSGSLFVQSDHTFILTEEMVLKKEIAYDDPNEYEIRSEIVEIMPETVTPAGGK